MTSGSLRGPSSPLALATDTEKRYAVPGVRPEMVASSPRSPEFHARSSPPFSWKKSAKRVPAGA